MKKISSSMVCLFLLFIIGTPNTVSGNGAAFRKGLDGAGVIPIQEDNIRLLEEEVVIDLRDNTVKCRFILKNLKEIPKKILMGFPFYSGLMRFSRRIGNWMEEKYSPPDSFTVFVDGNEMKTELQNTEKYSYVYAWDMNFNPNEKKIVQCQYTLIRETYSADGAKEYNTESFNYITHTGALWEGKIARATFKIYFNFNNDKNRINGPTDYFMAEVIPDPSYPNYKNFITNKRELKPAGYTWDSETCMAEYIFYDWEPPGDKEDIVFTEVKSKPDLNEYFYFKKYNGSESLYKKTDLEVLERLWENEANHLSTGGEDKSIEEVEKGKKLLKIKYMQYLRNEIFARHGYIFKDNDLQAFFSKMSWYKRDSDFDIQALSKIEKANVKFLLKAEKNVRIAR